MNFTNEQLIELTNPLNHKIIKLKSGDYKWLFNEDGNWVDRYFTTFDNYDKPASFLHYSLAVWNKELTERRDKEAKRLRKAYRKLQHIKKDNDKKNADKVRQVKALNLNLTNEEIGIELGISHSTVKRALNSFNQTITVKKHRKPKKKDSSIYYNVDDSIEVRTQSKEYKDYVNNYFKSL